jgi:APA family basic amino acid/polyamine antiporter
MNKPVAPMSSVQASSRLTASGNGSLKKTLGLFETTMSGVGIIIGAGIYALLGEVAGKAGDRMWLSFLIAGGISALVGLVYAEMASMFPKAGADYEYTRQALGGRVAFVIGWLIVIGNLVAAGTVALGFGSYLTTFLEADARVPALTALIVATLIAFLGIREAVWVSILLTVVEMGGLVFAITIGIPHIGDVNIFDAEFGTMSLFSGAALVLFAFIGFQQIATLSEEAENAQRVVPRAMLLAIGLTTLLYILVAVTSVSAVGAKALAGSSAPMTENVQRVIGERAGDVMAIVALFSTANTVLLLIVAASRMIYGMASSSALPRFLAWVHPGVQTPTRAIFISLLVSAGFTLSGDIGLVAGATNFAVLVGFAAVSLSLIILRFSHPHLARPFRVSMSVGSVPIVPVVAIIAVVFLMANLEANVLLIGLALFVSGLIAMEVFSLWRPHTKEETPKPH